MERDKIERDKMDVSERHLELKYVRTLCNNINFHTTLKLINFTRIVPAAAN